MSRLLVLVTVLLVHLAASACSSTATSYAERALVVADGYERDLARVERQLAAARSVAPAQPGSYTEEQLVAAIRRADACLARAHAELEGVRREPSEPAMRRLAAWALLALESANEARQYAPPSPGI
ncbi:MAG: hypothetical protein JNK02_02530 [Planctomycetes bacterium]|nr:hypothetical protein [Planctomycetota bacterium]